MSKTALDTINRAIWARRPAQQELDAGHGFVDPGERAAFEHVQETVRGKPVLDLGVGTGRTIPIYRVLTEDYRALDYLPEMVELSRGAYPGVTVELGDARELAGYPDGHFGLVNFSYNGIDAVSHADRARVFASVRRVLQPGGFFVFSTLNMLGPSYRERPWRLRVWGRRSPHRVALAVARQAAAFPKSIANWLKLRRLQERREGYAHAPLSAHQYSLLVHYTTLGRQLQELAQSGFDADGPVFDSKRGERVTVDSDTSDVDWFTVAARLTS